MILTASVSNSQGNKHSPSREDPSYVPRFFSVFEIDVSKSFFTDKLDC
jgi:hypothetical protein